jgi:hypothetical protein
MILINEANRFEMRLVGYQFPGSNSDEYDDNWLLVSISVSHPNGNWKSTDACLLTWEAARLANWMRKIADSPTPGQEEDFIEPELHFEVVAGSPHKLRVYFKYGFRPAWAPADGAVWVEFDISSRDLRAAAGAIEKDLSKFPQRHLKGIRGH